MVNDSRQPPRFYPDPLEIGEAELRADQRFVIRCARTTEELWRDFAHALAEVLETSRRDGRRATLLLSAERFDYRAAAAEVNRRATGAAHAVIFLAGEFCDERGRLVPPDHALSVRAHFQRDFVDALAPQLRPLPRNIVAPDPARPGDFGARATDEGSIDVCFTGLGRDGRHAFNVPEAPGEPRDAACFEQLTRTVQLPDRSRELLAAEYGVAPALVPPMAVTAGPGDVMRVAQLRLYLPHAWQAGPIRRVFYGPVTPRFPASIMQRHPELTVAMTEAVARKPEKD